MNKFSVLLEKTSEVDGEFAKHDRCIKEAKMTFIERVNASHQNEKAIVRKRPWVVIVAVSSLSAAAILAVLLGINLQNDSFSTEIPNNNQLSVSNDQSLSFKFDNGSRVVLTPGSEGRIAENDGTNAVVMLEMGSASFRVIHNVDTEWRVKAGPYEIQVTGTVFDVDWQPEEAHFLVKVYEGEVIVTGPLAEKGHKVAANQVFNARVKENKVELTLMREGTPQNNDATVEAQNDSLPGETDSIDPQLISDKKNHNKVSNMVTADWKIAAREGNYEAAMQIVEKIDKTQIFKKENPKDLFLLGNSARLTKRYSMAEQTYLAVRSRFKGTGHATAAALALGRMSFDQLHNYKKANSWLKTYLSEEQDSSLHREILGRLMESEHKSGALENARSTAIEYMKMYPNGPHADLARELMDE